MDLALKHHRLREPGAIGSAVGDRALTLGDLDTRDAREGA